MSTTSKALVHYDLTQNFIHQTISVWNNFFFLFRYFTSPPKSFRNKITMEFNRKSCQWIKFLLLTYLFKIKYCFYIDFLGHRSHEFTNNMRTIKNGVKFFSSYFIVIFKRVFFGRYSFYYQEHFLQTSCY